MGVISLTDLYKWRICCAPTILSYQLKLIMQKIECKQVMLCSFVHPVLSCLLPDLCFSYNKILVLMIKMQCKTPCVMYMCQLSRPQEQDGLYHPDDSVWETIRRASQTQKRPQEIIPYRRYGVLIATKIGVRLVSLICLTAHIILFFYCLTLKGVKSGYLSFPAIHGNFR